MTNEQLAQLRDPEHRMPGWWNVRRVCPVCNQSQWATDHVETYCLNCSKRDDDAPIVTSFTGPDWHASDDACFRDWRPVLLAAGWFITEALSDTSVQDDAGVTMEVEDTYRAAILAAVAWLAEHKPELLREAIAQVEEGK